MKVLLLDNYDSFTYMLKDYINQCKVTCNVIRNDDVALFDEFHTFDAIIISPGPRSPKYAGQLMNLIQKNQTTKKPLLGICLGHQAIGLHLGATLSKAKAPMHGKIDTIIHNGNMLFKDIPTQFKATRYHSLILENLPQSLELIANTNNNEVMGVAHKQLPIWGVQFHPESCTTEHGLQIIKNFLILAQQYH